VEESNKRLISLGDANFLEWDEHLQKKFTEVKKKRDWGIGVLGRNLRTAGNRRGRSEKKMDKYGRNEGGQTR